LHKNSFHLDLSNDYFFLTRDRVGKQLVSFKHHIS